MRCQHSRNDWSSAPATSPAFRKPQIRPIQSSTHGTPREEKSVGFDIFPIADEVARNFTAVAGKMSFKFLAVEPAFPLRSFEPAPLFGVLVDDDDPAAGLDNSADFANGALDVDCMLERFRGVGEVEAVVRERKRGQGCGGSLDTLGDMAQHSGGNVDAEGFHVWVDFAEDARESALTAAGVENTTMVAVAKVAENELNVIDTRIDGGRKMLFVAGRFVEGLADASLELRSQFHGLVRNNGRPTLPL